MGRKNKKKVNIVLDRLLAKLFFMGNRETKKMSLREKIEYVDSIAGNLGEYVVEGLQEIKLLKYIWDEHDSNSTEFQDEVEDRTSYEFALYAIIKMLIHYLRHNVYTIDDLYIFKYLMDMVVDFSKKIYKSDRFDG